MAEYPVTYRIKQNLAVFYIGRVSGTGTKNNYIEYVRSKQYCIAEYLGFPDQILRHSNISP